MLLDTTGPPSVEFVEPELIDPQTGEIVDPKNADQLIACFERTKKKADILYAFNVQVRTAIAKLTEGDAKTRRIRGETRLAKVEMPDDHWDQSKLKEAWNSYPKFRDEFLAIDRIRVRMREWKKLVNTTGEMDLEQFKKMVAGANDGVSGTPTVTVEK